MKMKKILALMISLAIVMSFVVLPVKAANYAITTLDTAAFTPVDTSSGWTEVTGLTGISYPNTPPWEKTSVVQNVDDFVMTFDVSFREPVAANGEYGHIRSVSIHLGNETVNSGAGADDGDTLMLAPGHGDKSIFVLDNNQTSLGADATNGYISHDTSNGGYNFVRTDAGSGMYTVPAKKVYVEKIGTALRFAIYNATGTTVEFAGSSTVRANDGDDLVYVQTLWCPIEVTNMKLWKEGVAPTPTPVPTPTPEPTPTPPPAEVLAAVAAVKSAANADAMLAAIKDEDLGLAGNTFFTEMPNDEARDIYYPVLAGMMFDDKGSISDYDTYLSVLESNITDLKKYSSVGHATSRYKVEEALQTSGIDLNAIVGYAENKDKVHSALLNKNFTTATEIINAINAKIATINPDVLKDEPEEDDIIFELAPPLNELPYPVATPTPAPEKGFTDLGTALWAEPAINALYDLGVVSGVTATAYEPLRSVTRAEYVTMVVKAFNMTSNGNAVFGDVPNGAWFTKNIIIAADNGIVSGKGDGNFYPNEAITKQDAAVILYRAAKNLTEKATVGLGDMDMVNDYAKEAVEALAKAGVVSGDANYNFLPLNNITRAEAAVMIHKALQNN